MGLTFATKPKPSFWRLRTLVVAVVVLALAAGAVIFVQSRDSGPPPLPASEVVAFLDAWAKGDTRTMSSLVETPPADLATTANSLVKSAPGSRAHYSIADLVRTDAGATATYRARVDLAGFGPLEWSGTLRLVQIDKGDEKVWRIQLKPADLYPGLAAGQHLELQRAWPSRAAIVAADGSFLAGSRSVVKIGIEPDRIAKSLPRIKKLMKELVGTDPADIDAALNGPGVQPSYFVEIATVPDDTRYKTVLRPQLAPVPGVFFQHSSGVLAPQGLIGAQLVGNVGEITAERLKELGAPYRVGDQAGLGGLQKVFEERLAGSPTGTVVISSKNKTVRTVKTFPGHTPQPVAITIDPHVQAAADSALAAVKRNAALVAVDVTTGQIRAIVSKPDNGFQRALDGSYPPGSTFKVITSSALLAAGNTGSTPAPCPATLTVHGKKFANFEGEASNTLDLAEAFQESCNNAFIGLADKLPEDALPKAATAFGFNARWKLPVPTYGGTFPKPSDRAELAASAIGQGRLLASPLQMASVAAAVASGQWRAPSLTTQPVPAAVSAPALDAGVAKTLREFMASVPQSGGTAAGAGLPSGTYGKTGTAEFGTGNPPETHAWFIGYRGNIAFAVIVEGGGVGGRVAAPLAAKFLNGL